MTIFALSNACDRSTSLGNLDSSRLTLCDIVRQSIEQINTLIKFTIFSTLLNKELQRRRFKTNDVTLLAGIYNPGKSFNQGAAFEDQVAFVFFGIFGKPHYDQIILTVSNRYTGDVTEGQPVLDFAIFGIQQIDGRLGKY